MIALVPASLSSSTAPLPAAASTCPVETTATTALSTRANRLTASGRSDPLPWGSPAATSTASDEASRWSSDIDVARSLRARLSPSGNLEHDDESEGEKEETSQKPAPH